MSLLKSGIRKDVAVSENKNQLINEYLKMYFSSSTKKELREISQKFTRKHRC